MLVSQNSSKSMKQEQHVQKTLVICVTQLIQSKLQYECQTRATRMRHKCEMSDTSETRTTRMRHQHYKNDTSKTLAKKFDFDNGTSENIFSHSFIHYMTNERLQGEEQFHSTNYLSEMFCSHAKMRLKSAPQKLNFVMAKVVSKSYTLHCICKCPCTFLQSYEQ